MKKKKSWAEIKATKSTEEWRKLSRAYNYRYRLRRELEKRGNELLQVVSNIRIFEDPGPANILTNQIKKAMQLRRAWGQEEYDHAVTAMNHVAEKIFQYQNRQIPKTNALLNNLVPILEKSDDTDSEKLATLLQLVELYANRVGMEQVSVMEKNATNYLATLMRKPDGHYPEWFTEMHYATTRRILSDEDMQKFFDFNQQDKNKESIANSLSAMLGFDKVEEKDKRGMMLG